MKYLLFALIITIAAKVAPAQQVEKKPDRPEVPVKLLPYTNPLTESRDEADLDQDQKQTVEIDKEILRRISSAYKMHVLAIDAQVQGDLVQAEEYINKSFEAIQSMMDDYPEIQSSRRFAELYHL